MEDPSTWLVLELVGGEQVSKDGGAAHVRVPVVVVVSWWVSGQEGNAWMAVDGGTAPTQASKLAQVPCAGGWCLNVRDAAYGARASNGRHRAGTG